MKKKWGSTVSRIVLVLTLIVFVSSFVSAANYVVGYVNDALDGEPADDKYVVLWNPENGKSDNLTDIVGVNGTSGSPNTYMIDCELLSTPCSLGDEMRMEVYDRGDNYVSNYTNITVTVSEYDFADNLSLNSPPSVGIVYPYFEFVNDDPIKINCSFSDLDSSFGEINLYSNFSGDWELVDTELVVDGYSVFYENVSGGEYEFYCEANDYLVFESTLNQSLIVDRTSPILHNSGLNESFFCGNTSLRMSCNLSDDYFMDSVWFSVVSPLGTSNYTATNVSISNYVYDLIVGEKGVWNVSCFYNDTAGNLEESFVDSFYQYSGLSELTFNSSDINFSNQNPWEDEIINITVNISNLGCVDADDFITSFFFGDPIFENYIGNVTVNVSALSSYVAYVEFVSLVGVNDVFVKADNTEIIGEDFENNNINNSILYVGAWQEFYGNISSVKVIGSFSDYLGEWGNDTNPIGNVFMADSESNIEWSKLLAIGRNITGFNASNDFSEIDSVLGMEGYLDSVVGVYGDSVLEDFVVSNINITNVSVIQSTDNDNFRTGILWDSSDDSNGEFDSIEKEDLVFVSKINDNSTGKYGSYDYEIKIPVRLREYDGADIEEVYFYYELN
jgi:hypothetical protein